MSTLPNAKRQRTNTIGAAHPAPIQVRQDYREIIGDLPDQIVRNLLIAAASLHPDVATRIFSEHNCIVAAQRTETIDFDPYSKLAWKALNVTYGRLSSSKQYEMAGEAGSEICDCINEIGDGTPAHASFGTKKSALETLRKIGKTIVLGNGDALGKEINMQFQYETCLETTMLRIAESMSIEECNRFMTVEFEDKLLELEGLADDQSIFENLKDVRLALLGVNDPSDEEEELQCEEVEEDDEDDDKDEDEEDFEENEE